MTHTQCSGDIVPMPAPIVMSTLNSYILLFVIVMSFVWILLYSFNFSFLRGNCKRPSSSVLVHEPVNKGADPARCFAASVVISLIVIALLWAFKRW
jgi:hypothetical protein